MRAVAGQRVSFTDGSQEDFDAVICATGYDLSLPFLSDAIRQTLAMDREHSDLFDFTFHPGLPGMAFLGMHDQVGPIFPVLELQARWVSYLWAGLALRPAPVEVARGIARSRAQRGL